MREEKLVQPNSDPWVGETNVVYRYSGVFARYSDFAIGRERVKGVLGGLRPDGIAFFTYATSPSVFGLSMFAIFYGWLFLFMCSGLG